MMHRLWDDPDFRLSDLPRYDFTAKPEQPRRRATAEETARLVAWCADHKARLDEESDALAEVKRHRPVTIRTAKDEAPTRRDWTWAAFAWLCAVGVIYLGNLTLDAYLAGNMLAVGMVLGAVLACASRGLFALLVWAFGKWAKR